MGDNWGRGGGGFGGSRGYGGGGYGGGRGRNQDPPMRPAIPLLIMGTGKVVPSTRDGKPMWVLPCADATGAEWSVAITWDAAAAVKKHGIGRGIDASGNTIVLTDAIPTRGQPILFVTDPSTLSVVGAGAPGSMCAPGPVEPGATGGSDSGHSDDPYG